MATNRFLVSFAPISVAALLLIAGCREEDEGPRVIEIEGTITRVLANPDGTGEIAASFRREKDNEQTEGVALVTAETRILINDKPATLGDLHEGERIHGQVRSEKIGKVRRYTALTVHADRIMPVDE